MAAAALPLEELLALAAGAEPCPAYDPRASPSPPPCAGEEAPLAAATPDPAYDHHPSPSPLPRAGEEAPLAAAAPGPALAAASGLDAVAAPAAAPASPLAAAPGAGEAREEVAEAAIDVVHNPSWTAPPLDLAPAAVQRTLLLPLAGGAGAAGGSQAWRGARLRVCIGYGVVHLPNAGSGGAKGAVHGETAEGEGLWMGLGICSDSLAPWLEGAGTSSSYGDSGSESGGRTIDCTPEADTRCRLLTANAKPERHRQTRHYFVPVRGSNLARMLCVILHGVQAAAWLRCRARSGASAARCGGDGVRGGAPRLWAGGRRAGGGRVARRGCALLLFCSISLDRYFTVLLQIFLLSDTVLFP